MTHEPGALPILLAAPGAAVFEARAPRMDARIEAASFQGDFGSCDRRGRRSRV